MGIINFFKELFLNAVNVVRDINKKYEKPRIKMTPLVSFSMFMLRTYLLLLVGILFYKFYTLVK